MVRLLKTRHVGAALALLLCLSLPASAEVECAQPEGANGHGVSAKSARERLEYLSDVFTKEAKASQLYMTVYGTSYLALIFGQLSLVPVSSDADKPTWFWGALNSFIGFAAVMFVPLSVVDAGPRFATRAKTVSEQDTCKLVEEGEKLLKTSFEEETFQRSWLIHLGNGLIGVGLGLVLALGYHQYLSAVLNGVASIAIGELMLWTQPNQLIPGWKTYLTGQQQTVTFHVVPTAGPGLGFVMRF